MYGRHNIKREDSSQAYRTCPRCGQLFEVGQHVAVVGDDILPRVTVHIGCVYESEFSPSDAVIGVFKWGEQGE